MKDFYKKPLFWIIVAIIIIGIYGYNKGWFSKKEVSVDPNLAPTSRQNACGDKSGSPCEVVIDKDFTLKGTWQVNARGGCSCTSSGGSL